MVGTLHSEKTKGKVGCDKRKQFKKIPCEIQILTYSNTSTGN